MMTFVMKKVEGKADLGRVESSFFLVKATFSLHVEHEVTAIHKLYHEEQSTEQQTHLQTHNSTLDCMCLQCIRCAI